MSQPGSARPSDPAALQAHIEATREQLAATLDRLAARMDPRTRAQERVLRLRDTVVETYRESPPVVLGLTAVLVVAAIGVVVRRRNR